MLPPFLGMLLTVITVGILALTLLLALVGGLRGSFGLVKLSGWMAGGALLIYGFFFGMGLLMARNQVLARGQAVRFCGLDCHLHVAVGEVRAGPEVIVRFSSNAVRAPERPAALAFSLVDRSGRRFPALNQVPDRALGPGESWQWALRFSPEAELEGASLVVTWKPGLDYLVPGAGNPLVQRHTRLALSE